MKKGVILILLVGLLIAGALYFTGKKSGGGLGVKSAPSSQLEEELNEDLDKVDAEDFKTDDLGDENLSLDPEVQNDLNEIERELNALEDNPFDLSDL